MKSIFFACFLCLICSTATLASPPNTFSGESAKAMFRALKAETKTGTGFACREDDRTYTCAFEGRTRLIEGTLNTIAIEGLDLRSTDAMGEALFDALDIPPATAYDDEGATAWEKVAGRFHVTKIVIKEPGVRPIFHVTYWLK